MPGRWSDLKSEHMSAVRIEEAETAAEEAALETDRACPSCLAVGKTGPLRCSVRRSCAWTSRMPAW
jgi:hypothetical protein